MTGDIIKLLSELNWNNKEKKTIAIKVLSSRKDYNFKMLIAPLQNEFYENQGIWWKDIALGCAIILSNKSDSEIINLLPDLLVWLQDLNWPGAVEVFERLKKIPYLLIKKYLNDTIYKAQIENDDQWIEWLTLLKKSLLTL